MSRVLSLITAVMLTLPGVVEAKLPPVEFLVERMQGHRRPKRAHIEITRFERGPERFSGTLELYSGSAAAIGPLQLSNESADPCGRILYIGLLSTDVASDLTGGFGTIDRDYEVAVVDRALVFRYGSQTSLAFARDSGDLVELRGDKQGRWRLVMARTADAISGTVYRNDVVFVRFNVKGVPSN